MYSLLLLIICSCIELKLTMDNFVIKKRKHGDSGEGEEGNESRSTSEKDLAISTANKSTSKKSRKNRSYLDNYLDLGFFWCGDEVNPTPLCYLW